MLMLIIFWDSQGVLLAHFQKHGKNVNSALCCEVLFKLFDAIGRKFPAQLATQVLLHHDNAQAIIPELQWELLEHQHYSLDFAPSDLHLFGLLKKTPWWQMFRS
jgi:hypothetical protein